MRVAVSLPGPFYASTSVSGRGLVPAIAACAAIGFVAENLKPLLILASVTAAAVLAFRLHRHLTTQRNGRLALADYQEYRRELGLGPDDRALDAATVAAWRRDAQTGH